MPVRGSRRARRRAGARAPAGRGPGRVSRQRRAGSACSTSIARTAARRSRWGATRNADCAACITAGRSTSKATSSTGRPSRARRCSPRRSSTRAYPCREAGGFVWVWMGPPDAMREFEPPAWAPSPDVRTSIVKMHVGCNWAQVLEGAIDSAHSSSLHSTDMVPAQVDGAGATANEWLRPSTDKAPRLQVRAHRLRLSLRGDPPPDQGRGHARLPAHHAVRRAVHRADPAEQPLQSVDPQHPARRHQHDVLLHRLERTGEGIDQEAWRKFCGAHASASISTRNFRRIRTRDNNYLQDRAGDEARATTPASTASRTRTSRCGRRWGRSPTARASGSARATSRSCSSAASWSTRRARSRDGDPAIGTGHSPRRVPHVEAQILRGHRPEDHRTGARSACADEEIALTRRATRRRTATLIPRGNAMKRHRIASRSRWPACALGLALACRGAGARHAQDRRRAARQLGHDGRRGRAARRHLQEAGPDARDPVDAGWRRDAAGGHFRQRRHRRRARHHGRALRLLQGRAGAHHRRGDHRRVRSVLVRPGGLADQVAQGYRRQDDRLLDQRLVDARRRDRVHEAVRSEGQADRDRRSRADAHAGHVGPDRRRLVGAAFRPAAARRRQDPRHRQRQ